MSYADYWKDGPYRDVPQTHFSVGTEGARMFTVNRRPPGSYLEPAMQALTLQLCVEGHSEVQLDLGAGRISETCRSKGWIVAPANQPCSFRLSRAIDLRVIELPQDLLSDGDGKPVRDLGVLHSRLQQDDAVLGLAGALWSERSDPTGLGALWEDQALMTLAGLLRRAAKTDVRVPLSGGLAPWQVRRTTEYLREHLDEVVSLADLARLSDLSPFHFSRAFKKSLGLPPHAFHCALRLEEAKRLLIETDFSVIEIALAVGYEAPQTLARVFQREVGQSPTSYRRERRP
jgi:AraC family transcriptional regulator